MAPLIMLNVPAIGPPEGAVAEEDGGLKAGVAPGSGKTEGSSQYHQ